MYKGYVLKHPITNEIRYVGITAKSLEERLANHMRDIKIPDRSTWHKSR